MMLEDGRWRWSVGALFLLRRWNDEVTRKTLRPRDVDLKWQACALTQEARADDGQMANVMAESERDSWDVKPQCVFHHHKTDTGAAQPHVIICRGQLQGCLFPDSIQRRSYGVFTFRSQHTHHRDGMASSFI